MFLSTPHLPKAFSSSKCDSARRIKNTQNRTESKQKKKKPKMNSNSNIFVAYVFPFQNACS